MSNCFIACDCSEVSQADFDRYTDKVENVLNDERGRSLFRNYMYTCKMRAGRRVLDFWERTEKLLSHKNSPGGGSPRNYNKEIKKLLNEAERIEEFDLATMERLDTLAQEPGSSKDQIDEVLKILKVESAHILRREYDAFRKHFVPRRN